MFAANAWVGISACAYPPAENPQSRSVSVPMRSARRAAIVQRMQPTYAVIWREGDGPVNAGKLVLGATGLTLECGARDGRSTTRSLRYDDIAVVESARRPAQRIRSRPTSLIQRRDREPLAIAALDGLGVAREILERLAGAIRRAASS
jgi:hypothetical protein